MLFKLIGKIVRSIKYKNTQPSHTLLIDSIIKDSGMCRHTLMQCMDKLIYTTKHTKCDSKSLGKIFSHDLDVIDRKYRGGMAFIFDELIDNVFKYRKHISAFEIYCIIGKCLNGK